MNILYLNNYNYVRGGVERMFLAEVGLMRGRGHTVHTFARRHPNNLPSGDEKYFPNEMTPDSLRPTLPGFRSLLQLFYSMQAKNCLTRMLKDIRIDVAHAHNIYGRLTTSVLDVLSERNTPILLTLHDYKLICPSYKLMFNNRICEDCKGGKYFRCVSKKCHKDSYIASAIYALESYLNEKMDKYGKSVRYFISPSCFLKEKLVEFGWPSHRICHIPNFVPLEEYEPQYAPGEYFLYLGRLSVEKGIPTLLDAFLGIKSDKARLHIAGDGPFKDYLHRKASLDSRVRFLG